MAMEIVDRLEPIEIEEDQGRIASRRERCVQLAHERRPVEETGEPVMGRLIGDLTLGGLRVH